ncbi:MAG: cytochrome c biogenesis CcdA family protein, partial [Geminicoccales bacterium]
RAQPATDTVICMLDISAIGLITAFAAGVISFLSPCVLPLVPGYVSFVAGSSLEDLRDSRAPRLQVLSLAGTFVLGFSLVFVAFGASATALGNLLLSYRYELGLVAGAVVILFGLHLLGLTPIRLMNQEARFHLETGGGRVLGALLLGIAFAFGWTPCIGPVLGAILTLGASTADVGKGALLLAVYSLGLGLPFLIAALFTGALLSRLKALGRAGRNLQRAAGGLLIVMGLLMVTGRLEVIAYWLLETFPALASIG